MNNPTVSTPPIGGILTPNPPASTPPAFNVGVAPIPAPVLGAVNVGSESAVVGAATPPIPDPNAAIKNMADGWDEGEDIKTGWIKLEVDQSARGTFLGKRYQKTNIPGFADQWVYELKVVDAILSIGFSIDKTFINTKLKNLVVGQVVMIKRFADVPSKKYPGKFAASYNARLFGMDPDYSDAASEDDIPVDKIPFN